MSWWWQDMDADNVYPLFAAMNEILGAAGWQEDGWTPSNSSAAKVLLWNSPSPSQRGTVQCTGRAQFLSAHATQIAG